jgi:hypothetical protein
MIASTTVSLSLDDRPRDPGAHDVRVARVGLLLHDDRVGSAHPLSPGELYHGQDRVGLFHASLFHGGLFHAALCPGGHVLLLNRVSGTNDYIGRDVKVGHDNHDRNAYATIGNGALLLFHGHDRDQSLIACPLLVLLYWY